MNLISIVIPIFNEEETIRELYSRLVATMSATKYLYEILFISDGSYDNSMSILTDIHRKDSKTKVIELARNFGHQAALSAGLEYAKGDAVILMDGDLQDQPEILPKFLKKWKDGYDIVYARKVSRKEHIFKRFAFNSFYKLFNMLSPLKIPFGAGIFSVMDRKIVDILNSIPERSRYISGLRAWVGFRQTSVDIERAKRFAGKPKQTLSRLFSLALDGLFSFSNLPLRFSIYFGLLLAFISIAIGLWALYQRIFSDVIISGWASVMISITFLGSMILVVLGIIGEYVGRIFEEVKQRPQYLVFRMLGIDDDQDE